MRHAAAHDGAVRRSALNFGPTLFGVDDDAGGPTRPMLAGFCTVVMVPIGDASPTSGVAAELNLIEGERQPEAAPKARLTVASSGPIFAKQQIDLLHQPVKFDWLGIELVTSCRQCFLARTRHSMCG